MNRRGFMAMVGAGLSIPALASKAVIPEATMRMARGMAMRNAMVNGTAFTTTIAGVRMITDIHWTEVSLNRKGNAYPGIGTIGEQRRRA